MSIFNVNGTELSSCYHANGNSLDSAYSINGVKVYSASAPKYPITNVIGYFRNPTLAVCDEVNGLSSDWESFVHITDPHGNANKQHSQAVGLYVLDNTPAKFLVLGGDYMSYQWDKSQFDTYMAPFIESGLMDNIYAVLGNHETMGDHRADSMPVLYDTFLKDKTNLVGELEQNYYYFDDADRRVRYMFINTSDYGNNEMTTTQVAWISRNAILPSSEWSLWVIGHITLNSMGGVVSENVHNGADIISAIMNCNGTIIGYLCGHQHCDLLYHDGNFQHVTLISDLMDNSNYYPGVSLTDRVAGTVSEQAVSVISFNTKTKQVVIRRIGAARNQTMSYSYA